MINKNELAKIRDELDNCQRPLFFFHDDADGLASFLLFYRYKKEGQGYPVKSRPLVDEKFLRKVESYMPDKIFILDVASVSEEFAENAKVPIVWIDHHFFKESDIPKNIKYFNPRKNSGENCPVTKICYDVVREKKDLWIAMAGCVGDWFIPPDLVDEFREAYPDLLGEEIKSPDEALFNSEIGKISAILNNVMKGNQRDIISCMKILTRIETPYELLNGETTRANFVLKHHKTIDFEYRKFLKDGLKKVTKSDLVIIKYPVMKISFLGTLSNEILYKYPKKAILVCRKAEDEYNCSFRSGKYKVLKILEPSLEGIEGYGGGHDYACGGSIKIKDFDKFLKNFRKNLRLGL